jgi:hypothetical protein
LELFAKLEAETLLNVADDLEDHPLLLAIFDKSHEYSAAKGMNSEVAKAGLEKEYFENEQRR